MEKSETKQKALPAEIMPLSWWKCLMWPGLVLGTGDSPEQLWKSSPPPAQSFLRHFGLLLSTAPVVTANLHLLSLPVCLQNATGFLHLRN